MVDVNSHCFQHLAGVTHESVFRISKKIIIETCLKHLLFVRKRQAILKQVWSCSGRISNRGDGGRHVLVTSSFFSAIAIKR